MATDPAIGRYRRWYTRLLHLYPSRFRDRFGEPMAQTFSDLCRERGATDRGLRAFVLATFLETSTGIVREHMTQLIDNKTLIRWLLITAAVLLVPFLAMRFGMLVPDPGRSVLESVDWGPFDFLVAGIVILGAGLTYELAASRVDHLAHRLAVALAVAAGLLIVWVNLATDFGDEGRPVTVLYLGVLAIAAVGAAIARLRPERMMAAMLVTAVAQAVVAIIAVVAALEPMLLADAFFVALWVASALLFRRAADVRPARHPVGDES